MRIAFIGGGNMGEAMLSAILNQGLTAPEAMAVSDISQSRRQYLQEKYGVVVTGDNGEAADGMDIVVLAIKPQHLAAVIGATGAVYYRRGQDQHTASWAGP